MPLYTAAEASTSSLLTYALAFGLIFALGFARAVWVRAKDDYKKTKAAVKPLRKAMWSSIIRTLKIGVLALLVGVALIAWVVAGDDSEPQRSTPAEVSSPGPVRSR